MANHTHPWTGPVRRYRASAMPNGDARFGIEGPIVSVREDYGTGVREKLYSRAEAENLRDELSAALRAFDVAEELASQPRAYNGPYPIRSGGTLAEVAIQENRGAA